MTKKAKLILLLIFAILLLVIYFLLWKNKAFAPHTILIQNSDNDLISEPEVSQSDSEFTNAESADLSEVEIENTEPTKENTEPEKNKSPKEKLPASPAGGPVTSYLPTGQAGELQVTRNFVSWGFSSASNRKIDAIIIHSSYNALGGDEYDVEKLIAEYKKYGVAPHYLIDRQGKIYQLVADKNIAYHAGESKVPDGRSGVNAFSLGIEMMNTKEDKYASDQYAALNSLLSTLKSRYSIKYTLGHNDISPGRKTDPWNFDWKKVK